MTQLLRDLFPTLNLKVANSVDFVHTCASTTPPLSSAQASKIVGTQDLAHASCRATAVQLNNAARYMPQELGSTYFDLEAMGLSFEHASV